MAEKKKQGRPPRSDSEYKKVADQLTVDFIHGKFKPGAVLPSRRRLAQTFEVSEKTVRLALDRLKEEGRVISTPGRKLLVGQQGAVASSRQNMVALVLSHSLEVQVAESAWKWIHQGIQLGVSALWDPFLIIHGDARRLKEHIPPSLVDESLKGILLCGNFHRKVLMEYERLNVPVILVDQPPGKRKLSSVCVDNVPAAADAVGKLVAAGHREIGFFRRVHVKISDIDSDSKERCQGFLKGCLEHGITDGRSRIMNALHDVKIEDELIERIFSRKPRFTAFVTADGALAKVLKVGAEQAGLRVPEDFSIVCFDALQSNSNWTGPRSDFYELGRRAVFALDDARRSVQLVKIQPTWEPGQTMQPLA